MDNTWTILGVDQLMKWCTTATDHDLDPEFLGEAQSAVSRFVYGMLVQLCSGKALVTIRLVTAEDGLKAWKKLVTTYEPAIAIRWNAMLSGILNPQWNDDGDFEVQLLEWEHKVDKYTNVTQVQVPDSIKCATVMRWAPTSVRDYLHRSPIDVMTNYGVLRSQLVLYFTKARTYDNLGNITNEGESKAVAKTPTPVLSTLQEVLAMFEGKGKGKDGQKGKGGSKDEGKSNT